MHFLNKIHYFLFYKTALIIAVEKNNAEIVRLLLSNKNTDVNIQCKIIKNTFQIQFRKTFFGWHFIFNCLSYCKKQIIFNLIQNKIFYLLIEFSHFNGISSLIFINQISNLVFLNKILRFKSFIQQFFIIFYYTALTIATEKGNQQIINLLTHFSKSWLFISTTLIESNFFS